MQTIKNTTTKIFLFFLIGNLFFLTSIKILNFNNNMLWSCLHFRLSHIFSSLFLFFDFIMIVFFVYCLCYFILCWWHELRLLFGLYVGRIGFVVVLWLFWWSLFLGTHLRYSYISRYIFIICILYMGSILLYIYSVFICLSVIYHTIMPYLMGIFCICFVIKDFFM